MAGAKHLWVGDADRVLDEIVRRVVPGRAPLPRDWYGPMEYGGIRRLADSGLAGSPRWPPGRIGTDTENGRIDRGGSTSGENLGDLPERTRPG